MLIQIIVSKAEAEDCVYAGLMKNTKYEVIEMNGTKLVYTFDYKEFIKRAKGVCEESIAERANVIADNLIQYDIHNNYEMEWTNQEKWSFIGWLKLLASKVGAGA